MEQAIYFNMHKKIEKLPCMVQILSKRSYRRLRQKRLIQQAPVVQ